MITQLRRAAEHVGPVVGPDVGDVINLLHVYPGAYCHRQGRDVFPPQHLGEAANRTRVGARGQDDGDAVGVVALVFVVDVDDQILDGLIQEGRISSSVMQLMNALLKQPFLNLNK